MIVRLRTLVLVLLVSISTVLVSYELTKGGRAMKECAPFQITGLVDLDEEGRLKIPASTSAVVLQLGVLTRLAEPGDANAFVIALEPDPFRRAIARSLASKGWKGIILPFAIDRCDGVVASEGWKIGIDDSSLPTQALKMSTISSILPRNISLGLVVLDSRPLQMYIAAKSLSMARAVKIVGPLGISIPTHRHF